ncbi:hypothetical protein B0H66DRAFT_396175 [Apodospora peruviana]|uniref:Uncharacterized protein n=1 Tax=Apodospora peruviana TaxID=516989 RepID=A0AAE0HSU6_9PEZI|nr:hypothetical protein B0H66DRAFT_396175 [Apodospora peruviana]
MGCLNFFRRKRRDDEDTQEKHSSFAPRPLHDSVISADSAFSDVSEKPLLGRQQHPNYNSTTRNTSPLPSAAINNIRPNVHHNYSAYAGVAASDQWTGSQMSTQVSTRASDTKLKDEGGVNDPEHIARQKKAAEIRRKFEEEEQDRLDFFQMM